MLSVTFVLAQKVKFSSYTDKKSYYDSETINLVFKIENADYKELEVSELKDFTVVNKYVSSNSGHSVVIINGKKVSESSEGYELVYQLKPLRKGVLTVPESRLVHDGKVYKAPSFSIEVKGLNVSESQSSSERFVKVEVSNKNPYVGEPLTVTYTLFTVDQISDAGQIKTQASFQNFGAFTAKELSKFSASSVVMNGKKYMVLELQKHLLTPVKSGSVKVPSFDFEYISYQYRQFGFFTQKTGEIPHLVKAPGFTVAVRELPAPPVGFSGLVGGFKLTRELDKKELPINDALTVTYQLQGNGNFDALQDLKLQWDNSWEVFDPKRKDLVKADVGGYKGKLLFEYVAIPRDNGKQEIPSLELVYFNLKNKKYETLSVETLEINVTGDKAVQSGGALVALGKQKVEEKGKDIRYLQTEVGSVQFEESEHGILFPFVLGALASGAVLYLFIGYRPRNYTKTELQALKKKQANKKAKKILSSAYLVIDNDAEFYAKIQESLNQFLMDKLLLSQSELTKIQIEEKLAEQGVDEELKTAVLKVYSECAQARYSNIGVSKTEMYENVEKVVALLV